MIPDDQVDILEKNGFANVATIGPDGEPQNNPVWFAWDGETIAISQTPDKQKFRNLERDPRVALSILDPDNPYRYLEVRGEVAEVEPDPDYAFIHSLANRYMGQDYPYLQPGEERVIVKIRPLHTTSL
ncbi:MAG: PPOX class F420-dependent oxidoreductase [Ilumatobacter sp.]|nr:PPOX class F420-dependent oxidoreductase [Ilumatobacter sp.]